jgi:hypothetical protein
VFAVVYTLRCTALNSATMHHEIVALESQHQPLPVDGFYFPASITYTQTSYEKTSTRAELHARIYYATILIVTTVNIDAETLDPSITPHLRYIAVSATGVDLGFLCICFDGFGRLHGFTVGCCGRVDSMCLRGHYRFRLQQI